MTYVVVTGITRPVYEHVFNGHLFCTHAVVQVEILAQYGANSCVPRISETYRRLNINMSVCVRVCVCLCVCVFWEVSLTEPMHCSA